MTTEARLAFIVFFFAVWCFLGLMAWAIAAVITRGRGALPALPLALAAAAAAGVAVPLLGARDVAGFFASLGAALLAAAVASAAGIRLARKVWPLRPTGPTSRVAPMGAVDRSESSHLTPDT